MTHYDREKKDLLPLGSVVVLKDAVKKLLIVSRGAIVDGTLFDYGALLYPEGMIDESVAYFNEDDVVSVIFEGYRDDDDDLMLGILANAYERFELQEKSRAVFEGALNYKAPEDTNARAEGEPGAGETDWFASVRDLEDEA